MKTALKKTILKYKFYNQSSKMALRLFKLLGAPRSFILNWNMLKLFKGTNLEKFITLVNYFYSRVIFSGTNRQIIFLFLVRSIISSVADGVKSILNPMHAWCMEFVSPSDGIISRNKYGKVNN